LLTARRRSIPGRCLRTEKNEMRMDYEKITAETRDAVNRFLTEHWFSTKMAVRGRLFDLAYAPGFLALEDGEIRGLLTYAPEGEHCEILSLDSLTENRGVGTELLRRMAEFAREQGFARLTLVTTNDNLRAIGFYQKRGFDMTALFHGAVDEARLQKPEIPLIGDDGIPLHHEIAFTLELRALKKVNDI
jgi:GNAT superfamily N-acetyltransferase